MQDPKFMQPANLIVAAASRLIAAVQYPYPAVKTEIAGMYTSAMLNIVVEANITEALKEANPEGLHVRELANKVGMESDKLARCLRYLCARHIYREVSPNVFANNRLSIALDTQLPFEEVKDREPTRYDRSLGAAAFVGLITGDFHKGAAMLPEILLDPKRSSDMSITKSPTTQSLNFDGSYFDWIEQPGNEMHLHRFSAAMKNTCADFTGFDWDTLPKGSIVVDVGGGVGSISMRIAKRYPTAGLRFIVQDRAPTIADGEKFWQNEWPEAISTKMVALQAHDIFNPQPVKDAAVFFLRYILHQFSDDDARIILTHLRESAAPSTKLVILEQTIPYTCPDEDPIVASIPGAPWPKLPAVFRGNPGQSAANIFMLDMVMMGLFASRERTVVEWNALFESAGWKLDHIKRERLSSMVCIPA